MAGPENQQQHQKQQDSGAMFLNWCLWQGRRFSNRVDCYNVQHDGGIGQKTVEDTINDDSRIQVSHLSDSWEVIEH